ncbi:hypothetical protein ACVWVZ_005378 [Pseudomonas tolaasii]
MVAIYENLKQEVYLLVWCIYLLKQLINLKDRIKSKTFRNFIGSLGFAACPIILGEQVPYYQLFIIKKRYRYME